MTPERTDFSGERRRLRVVLVNQESGMGGSERVVFQLAQNLDAERFDVIACAFEGDGPMQEEYRRAGLAFYDLRKRRGVRPSLIPRLRRFFRQHRIDIVHTHDFGPPNYCYFATRMLRGTVWMHTHHALFSVFAKPRQSRLLRKVLPRTDALVCVSDSVRRDYLQRVPPARKMVTIYNGVDLSRFRPDRDARQARKRLGLEPDSFVIGCVTGLRPKKGHAMLIRAFRTVLAKARSAHLVLAGGGELIDECQRLAHELGLGERVHFLGVRDDVPEIMSALDVYCLCSDFEGMPVSILEAMASGKAIVATNVSGTSDVVENGKTGMLVPAQDADACASALLHLHDHPAVARSMASAAHERAEEQYSLEAMVRQYGELYDELALRKGRS